MALEDSVANLGLAIVLPVLIAYALLLLLFAGVFYVLSALILRGIAKRVGEGDSWMAWVPLLNIYYITRLAQAPAWTLITLAGAPFHAVFMLPFAAAWAYWWWKIAERRNKSPVLGLLMLVPLVNILIALYLAWSGE